MGSRIDKGTVLRAGVQTLLLLGLAATPARAGSLGSPGCMAGGATAVVASIDEALDLHLSDGRIVHLPGIAVPEAADQARRDLSAWLTQAVVNVAPLRAEPDRWGRTVALAFAAPPTDPGRPVSVTEALIEAGRVLARPDPALDACWATNLRLERGAEQRQEGLWLTSPVLQPNDKAQFEAKAGTLAIVGGRISAVREGRARLYLRLPGDGGTGMAAALALPLVRRLAKAGTNPRDWVGRRLRVRGLLDSRWGWQIEVTATQQLEFDAP